MNRLARAFWTLQAIGWENLPARAWQIAKRKLRLLEKRLPGGELPADELAKQFDFGRVQTPSGERSPEVSSKALWIERARRLGLIGDALGVKRSAIRNLVSDADWERTVGRELRDLQAGRMRFFSRHVCEVGGPPNFNRDPMHGVDWPTGRHWTTYDQFNPKYADLKCVWEPSRFSWAYALARDYGVTGNASAAATFWQFLDAWDRQNPYGLTPQWSCGQESSFRCFAWMFAACATVDSPAATAERLKRLTELVWYTGRHVAENLVYARSQKNNHAISEAVCLYMIGTQFPELRSAATWRDEGRRSLLQELDRQLYSDGSYVQHSLNYHRVMLDDLLWAAALFAAAGEPAPDGLQRAIERAADWLGAMVDPRTGIAPNYGANDGALVLPLSTCDYTDFRPCLTAARRAVGMADDLPAGPWREGAIWLGFDTSTTVAEHGSSTRGVPANRAVAGSRAFEVGGYFVFCGEASRGMVRCHAYRDRPNQCDMLHFDLTHRGVNVLRDGGTFHYYTQEPWQSWFYSTAAHNTVELDGENQMLKGPRFLWLRWVKARCLEWRAAGQRDRFVGEQYGYQRLPGRPIHRRTIEREGDRYRIEDEIRGGGTHEAVLRWRLPPGACEFAVLKPGVGEVRLHVDGAPWRLTVEASAGARITLESIRSGGHSAAGEDAGRYSEDAGRNGEDAGRYSEDTGRYVGGDAGRSNGGESARIEGWESRYYAERTTCPVLRVAVRGPLPIRIVTTCGPV